jgi:hypothetical protein
MNLMKVLPITFVNRDATLLRLSAGGSRYRIDLGYRMPVQGEYVDKVFAAAGFNVANQGDRIVPLLFDVPGRISIG